MTDDLTGPIETPAATAPVTTAPARRGGPSRLRWAIGLAVAALAVSVAAAAVVLLGAQATPEALKYIPGDAVVVAELRMDLPGDQMQALGNLLAHFPGFKDQATLQEKLDQAFSKAIATKPDSGIDYATQVKPFLTGPTFFGITSLEDMAATEGRPAHGVVVSTTNGAVTCATAFKDQTLTHDTYRSLDLSLASDGKLACVVDGRFFIAGDTAQVKRALDAHADGTGMDASARYKAARAGLGKDRLATLYVDGVALKSALPAATSAPTASGIPAVPLGNVAAALPEWIMAGVRAENDAMVFDTVTAPVAGATPDPSFQPLPAAHASILAPLAPADSLVFVESQGVAASLHNMLLPLQANPQLTEALGQLDQFGGVDGLVGWVDDAGVVVLRNGDAPAGALLLVAHDAASATEKVTTLKTVLTLAANQMGADVTQSTVGDVKVTTLHIPDAGALLGGGLQVGGSNLPPFALDLSIAVRDRVVYLGIGEGVLTKVLGVAAGASLADDPAFKRALGHGLADPQAVVYLAAGASLDWLETIIPAEELARYTADVKPYVDPLESVLLTVTGDGRHGSTRLAFIVATP
jgi:hypothetical protein